VNIGIFGLGLIGLAAARRLLAAGHKIQGWDPSPQEAASFAALGGHVTEPDKVWNADVVILAVFDTEQARTVLAGRPADCAPDVMLMTTSDPAGVASLVPVAGPCALVEVPVSGTSAQLAKGEATIWLAGDAGAVDRIRPVAAALTSKVVRLGAFGEGARVKLCVNLILGLNRAALAEGLTLARALGLDPLRFLDLARGSAAESSVMATKGPRMVAGDFAPEGRVMQSAKDFGLILGAAAGAAVTLPFANVYAGLMADLIAAGKGDLDNSAIIQALQSDLTMPVGTVEAL
jgi:3-hydroxyisobutyrate dehydrogenase-like beta-hydroxyacid dehydrogenase